MNNRKRKITQITLIFLIFLVLLLYIFFYLESKNNLRNENFIVSKEEFKEYIETYLSKYKQLVENNIPLESREEFKFYENYPYEVMGILSTSHGAAIFFNHSSITKITVNIIEKRIEFYVWPQMEKWWNNASTYFVIKKDEKIIFPEQAGDDPIIITKGGRIEIFGVLIYENKMLLKGCNKKDCWSKESAELDALLDFLRVAKEIIKNEAELKEIEGINKLIILADKIARNERNGLYTDNTELLAKDYKEYFELAREFGIETQIATNILKNEIEKYSITPKTPWYYNSYIVGVITSIIGGIFIGIFRKSIFGYMKELFGKFKKYRKI